MAVLGLVSRRKSSVRWFVLVGLVEWSAGWAVPLWGRSACPVFRWAAFAPGAFIYYFYTYIHSPAKKNGTLISQQQFIPIIPILMCVDQEAMIANITLNIRIGYFISNFA
jgi:hypothetical protein